MAQFRGSESFTVPAGAGSYAPERLTFARRSTELGPISLIAVTAAVKTSVADSVVELWLLSLNGDPDVDGDWIDAGKSIAASGSDTWPLAGWDGAQIRVKSGGTAGTAIVHGSAD